MALFGAEDRVVLFACLTEHELEVTGVETLSLLNNVSARRTFRPYVQLRHHVFLLSHMLEWISATITAGQFLYFFKKMV